MYFDLCYHGQFGATITEFYNFSYHQLNVFWERLKQTKKAEERELKKAKNKR